MLKYKVGNEYVPANQIEIRRDACPIVVGEEHNGGFMKVISGIWAVSLLFRIWVENDTLNVQGVHSTVSSKSFTLPAEVNPQIQEHVLVRS